MPARLEPLQDARLEQERERGLAGPFELDHAVPARAVARHLEAADPGRDLPDEAGIVLVQVVALGREPGLREADRGAVGKGGPRIPRLDEAAVAAHADHVGERKEKVRIEVLRVALVGSGVQEQPFQGADPVRGEGLVVAGEREDHVVEVPQAVVDRGGGQEEDILLPSPHQPGHGAVPDGVGIPQRVGLVEDHQPIGVLVRGEDAQPVPGLRVRQLLVGREGVIADHLRGQPGPVELGPPLLAQLRGHDDENVLAAPHGVLLDEGHADEGLPRADAVGVDHAAMPVDDSERPAEAVLLEGREPHGFGRRAVLLQHVAEELQQGAQVHRPGIEQPDVREEELAEIVLVGIRLVPELVEPPDRALRDLGVVVDQPELQVLPHPGRREIGRRDERGAGVGPVAEEIGFPVQELRDVAANVDVGTIEPLLDREEALERAAGREAGDVAFLAKRQQGALEEGRRELAAEPGRRGRAQKEPRGAVRLDRGREVVEAAQVDVPGRDGEVVTRVQVVREVDQAVAVDRVRAQVVEEGGAAGHGGSGGGLTWGCHRGGHGDITSGVGARAARVSGLLHQSRSDSPKFTIASSRWLPTALQADRIASPSDSRPTAESGERNIVPVMSNARTIPRMNGCSRLVGRFEGVWRTPQFTMISGYSRCIAASIRRWGIRRTHRAARPK